MPEGTILAKGLVQRIGEDHSEASQSAVDLDIRLTEPIMNHRQGLQVIRRMLVDEAKGPIESMSQIGACGHRVVHGGEAFTGSVNIDERLEEAIEKYSDLAPLHNPPNLVGIREAKRMLGSIPQVACFDTAFHQSIPQVAYLYGLPYEMYDKYKIRKYGFHGTSHRYVARRAAAMMNRGKHDVNLITCHLGNGCSITAVQNGKSADTSMGFTPLEGLMMGTRAGDFDPAVIFHLQKKGYEAERLDAVLNKQSGLLGISGISNDVRDLEEKAEEGEVRARLALDIFAYRVRKYMGAYLAVLNGCDGIIFTGGIGENGSRMRKRILENMEHLGIEFDEDKNDTVIGREGVIQAEGSKTAILVIPTDEEGAIAHDTYLIATGQGV